MSPARPLYVIDSSVAYKWFNDENESHVSTALELLQGHRDGTLLLTAPAHMPTEVLNGLRYSRLGDEYLRRVPGQLAGAEVALVPLDGALLAQALELALAYDLTIHDALFPALAVQLDCDLVTADRAMARVTECPVRLLA
ncbi:MAG: type II toxin-antitoxin system VapC family toxin [Coriobacteriia bacterium]|nr:type II toxin-antitoxin system VapC family toxin [Coriobacteriia bacterium]